jgi:hypothetical protein
MVCSLWQNEVTAHHSKRRKQTMSEKIIQLNEGAIKGELPLPALAEDPDEQRH